MPAMMYKHQGSHAEAHVSHMKSVTRTRTPHQLDNAECQRHRSSHSLSRRAKETHLLKTMHCSTSGRGNVERSREIGEEIVASMVGKSVEEHSENRI
jgi:hypothetical protein